VTNLAILRRSFLLLFAFCTTPVQAEDEAWTALREGRVVALIRHARAPGTGDPAGFRLDDCSTQRNLSEQGRAQARQLGTAFTNSGVIVTRVLSSRWCRALETARLAFGIHVEPFQPLDSFFGNHAREAQQTSAVKNKITTWRGPGVLALVTHQVNVTALTGVVPAEGEIVVVRPAADGIAIVGTIRP
jgi:phosphohistidine phosphatase SixA